MILWVVKEASKRFQFVHELRTKVPFLAQPTEHALDIPVGGQ